MGILMHLSRTHHTFRTLCLLALLGSATVCHAVPDDKTLIKLADAGSTKLLALEREHSEVKNDAEQREYARELQKDINEEKRRCNEYKSAIRALAPKVKKSGKIDLRDDKGRTLLMLAAALGNNNVTEMVLRENPDLSLFDKSNKIAMDYEQASGGTAVSEHLKPLWEQAVASNNIEIIRKMLDSGASADWQVNGQPPLALAIESGQNAIVDLLLLHGAQAGNRLSDGCSLVELAVRNNNSNALDGLLGQLKETNIILSDGAPLFRHLLHEEAADCLVVWYNHANTLSKAETEDGTSYFCLAMRMADTTGAIALANSQIKLIKTEDKEGNLPLHEAARCGDTELYKELVRLGADPAQKNARGETVLMHAALSSSPELLAEVLKGLTPEQINATDKDGYSAFHYAKLAKDKATGDTLRNAGLQPQQKD